MHGLNIFQRCIKAESKKEKTGGLTLKVKFPDYTDIQQCKQGYTRDHTKGRRRNGAFTKAIKRSCTIFGKDG